MVDDSQYRTTVLGTLPNDWQVIAIGDYAFVTKLAGFEYTLYFDYSKSGPIIAIRGLNIKNGGLDLSDVHTIPESTSESLPRSRLSKGDLVITYVGTIGRVAVIPEDKKYHLAPNVAKLVVNRQVADPSYVCHYLNSEIGQQEILKAAASTTQAAMSMQNLRRVLTVLPPLSDQRAIAAALSDVDDLIAGLDQLISKKRAVKHAAMHQLLTGKTRLPGFDGEWKTRVIGNVAPLQRGFDLPNTLLRPGVHPVVYSNGILNHHAEYKVRGPGVVTGRSGTIGNVTYVGEDFWPHNTSLWVTNFNGNSPRFIYYFYSYIDFERFATGSGVPTLNRNDVHAWPIQVPPTCDEQDAIALVLSDMDAEIAALEQKRDKTHALKQGMMQELLTGKIRLV